MSKFSKLSFLALIPFMAAAPSFAAAAPQLGDASMILPKVHSLNQSEIDAGDWAAVHACDQDVKNYAQMIAKDHRNSDIDVMAIIQQQKLDEKKVAWTVEEGVTVAKQKAEALLLKAVMNCDFDRRFLNDMVDAHQFAIQELKNAQGTVTLPAVADYITKTLPALQSHLDQANALIKAGK